MECILFKRIVPTNDSFEKSKLKNPINILRMLNKCIQEQRKACEE